MIEMRKTLGDKGTMIAYGTGSSWKSGQDVNKSNTINQLLIDSIKTALYSGYRHIDCAEFYGTEREVGIALNQFLADNPNLSRADFFITSKVFQSISDIRRAISASLSRIGTTYLDLYLIHSPFYLSKSLSSTWSQMESLVDAGLTHYIGVSNYRIEDFQSFLPSARIKPVCNQIEFHPYLQQPELIEFCEKERILVCGYSPLVPLRKKDGPLNPVIQELALNYKKTGPQILIQWVKQKGMLVITTSREENRLREVLELEDKGWELTKEDMIKIDSVGRLVKERTTWKGNF